MVLALSGRRPSTKGVVIAVLALEALAIAAKYRVWKVSVRAETATEVLDALLLFKRDVDAAVHAGWNRIRSVI